MSDLETTVAEDRALAALRRTASKWPSSLWLFAAAGTLHVMKVGPDGERVATDNGGVDQSMIVETIPIPCDGGDW
jgi:hypothetical protein